MKRIFLSHADAAKYNRNNILHYIKEHGPMSRTDIWEQLDISRASVTQIIRQLQESNLILEIGEGESNGGRKPQYIRFNGMAKKLYAFDWMSHSLCLMSMGGDILYEKKLTFPPNVTQSVFASILDKEIDTIEKMNICDADDIVGLGMALPGIIDSRSAVIVDSVELGWQNVSLRSLFRRRFSENIFLERYGNLMALGEYSSKELKGTGHFQLYVLDENGIGVSTIVHDNCQHGANYMHGELGHIKMPSDIVCSCGQKGCLEAIVNDIVERNNGQLPDEALDYLAIGVSTSINLYDVKVAVLVGSYVESINQKQKDRLLEKIHDKLVGQSLREIEIYFSGDTKQISLLGICEYVFDCYFARGYAR